MKDFALNMECRASLVKFHGFIPQKTKIFVCGAVNHLSNRCKENTNSVLVQATLCCQTLFYCKGEFSV